MKKIIFLVLSMFFLTACGHQEETQLVLDTSELEKISNRSFVFNDSYKDTTIKSNPSFNIEYYLSINADKKGQVSQVFRDRNSKEVIKVISSVFSPLIEFPDNGFYFYSNYNSDELENEYIYINFDRTFLQATIIGNNSEVSINSFEDEPQKYYLESISADYLERK